MKCFQCGGAMTSKRETYDYGVSGLPVMLQGVEVRRCKDCGEEEVAIPRIEELHRLLAAIVVSKKERLTGSEVRYLRKWLGWSGIEFAKHMGVSAECVSRWENGKEQIGPVADRALRLMVMIQTPVSEYPAPPLDTIAQIGEGTKPVHLTASDRGGTWTARRASEKRARG